jgi:hypothetical protein
VSTTPARNKPNPTKKYVGVKFRPNPSSQAPPKDGRGQCERYISEANKKKIEMANMKHPGFLISEILQKTLKYKSLWNWHSKKPA